MKEGTYNKRQLLGMDDDGTGESDEEYDRLRVCAKLLPQRSPSTCSLCELRFGEELRRPLAQDVVSEPGSRVVTCIPPQYRQNRV